MGVLDIRMRSASRDSLRRVSVAPASNRYQEIAANNRAGIAALHRGISQLGQGIASFGNSVEQMENRRVDEAIARRQQALNEYNQTAKVQEIADGGELQWKADNVKFREDYDRRLQEEMGLSDRQMAQVHRRSLGFDLTMQNGWDDRAEKVGAARQFNVAAANQQAFNATCADPHADPMAWSDWYDGVDRLIRASERRDGREYSPEERQAVYRQQGQSVFKGYAENQAAALSEAAEQTARAGGDGSKVFDDWLEGVKKTGGSLSDLLPDSTWLARPKEGDAGDRGLNFLRDALEGADAAKLRDYALDLVEKEKTSWRARRDAEEREGWKIARQNSRRKELEFLKTKVPDDPKAQANYCADLANKYSALAEDKTLSADDRLSYTQMARRFESAESRQSDYAKDSNYRQLNRNVSLDCRPSQTGDSSSFVPYSYEDQKKDVDQAFADGKITAEQWNDLATRVNSKVMKKTEESEDTFAVDLLNAIAAKYPSMRPRSIKYNKRTNSVYFDPAASTQQHKITAESTIPGLVNVWGSDDEEEDATYDQLKKVVQSTLLMRRNLGNKMTVAEGLEQVEREFGPTARGRAARTAAEKISGLESASLAW